MELSYKIQSLRPLHIEGDLMAQNGVRISSKATPVKTNIAKYQCFDVLANGFTWFGYSKIKDLSKLNLTSARVICEDDATL